MEFENFPSVTFSAVTDGKVIGTGSMTGSKNQGINDSYGFSVCISIKGSGHIHLLSMG